MFEPSRIHTLWELVEYRARVSRGAPMFFDGDGRSVTFDGVRDEALRVAGGFRELGIGAGTRVVWQLPTRIETVVASLALARLGAVQTPVIPLHREREVGFILAESAAEFVLLPGVWRGFDHTAMVRKLAGDGVRVVSVAGGLPQGDPGALPQGEPGAWGAPAGAGEGRAADDGPGEDEGQGGGAGRASWVYYTSGTTSSPKGVEHTDATLLAGGIGLATALGMSADDIGSIAFPYAHIAGPDYVIAMLVSGFPAVILESFEPGRAAAVYRRHGVTMAGGSTAFYQAFLDESRRCRQRLPRAGRLIPSLRLLSGGGAPMPPELYAAAGRELGCAIVHGYGMTECPMITMGTPYDSDEQLARTVGKPVVGAQVRIVLPDGSEAGTGELGEVTLKGAMLFRRYTDPALTAAAFAPDGSFRTGDLGYLRPDGHLVLTGRLKDIIIRKGENISAQEIEELVRTHPAVADAAVIGLPDRERGERVCAVVTPADPAAPPLSLDGLTAHLRAAGLMTQKLPEQLEIVGELPRGGPLNKVLKASLRERYTA
ncbi:MULTISPECIES: class I adenylate-forming enzyme family protein [unclassified Streptomyces]|uniref:class I adenylate-forming enzyme family protein n=1 Tax=unclassified Streptomyces TaxID=2593676 RepID=UPI0008833AF6|nr:MULTISPECIES: AMP-binding protein [unclassified Streptomyces]PBC83056.1 acyl-CoA synthetase (AMP-forming)/AMP-acid ligase II [Streptomyces sp. 2321.6]SDR45321.1 Acyl-CoA synthetase (AMP-forming)/AMP-acid ligase II [Streptomyces sp. KS_16]SEC82299.1 Acyl-CoA synthetase (AMP-forming)/AMP-acid ligase II [Streptomyces sp. 2133.1]SNC69134.1 Acyl-CoA synthetase (AMP-forming)/AMP-acid ligase II [Streptomyces sp. 2114.4]